MGTARRAYDLLRGYVHHEWERLQDLDRSDALRELEDAIDATRPNHVPVSIPKTAVPIEDQHAYARRVLGVGDNASFAEIRKAFDKLNTRADPARFPGGSEAAREASDIQKRIHWAYGVLTEKFDSTEKRFRSLEID